MLHVTTVVSRKTPLDGRLEIPASLADRLSAPGGELVISLGGEESAARLEVMACTCAKGAGGNHLHHFLAAESLTALPAGATVNLSVDMDEGRIGIQFGD